MKTSLNETAEIEKFLFKSLSPERSLLFEAKRIIDTDLEDKIKWQAKTYHLVQIYGRKKLKAELETIHQKLFTEPEHIGFRKKIMRLFN